MSYTNLSPVPYQTPPVTGQTALISNTWSNWFRNIYSLILSSSQIDATEAAAAAASSATQANSAASVASASSSSASGFATASQVSAVNSATSATSASNSATSAAESAAEAAAVLTGQTFSPYIISASIVVPAGTQMLTFDRVTLQSGGRLQINGRGRIFS